MLWRVVTAVGLVAFGFILGREVERQRAALGEVAEDRDPEPRAASPDTKDERPGDQAGH